MTIIEFMKGPTREQWMAEIEAGWEGPDGSSMSSDHIMGVRIGEVSPDYAFRDLPANLHDYRYRLGRRHKLGRGFRLAADVAYRKDCIEYVANVLDGRTAIGVAIARSWVRYWTLRLFGGFAFKT